jgi:hypothetical protein
MSYQQPPPGFPGGAFFPQSMKPIWHPPVPASWIASVLILVAAVNLPALPPQLLQFLIHPFGFFVTLVLALFAYDGGSPQIAFSMVFLLLIAWSKQLRSEGFSGPSGTVDWVTNTKRWFVEVVLKEKPLGIQEKKEITYPVQGDNSLPSSA